MGGGSSNFNPLGGSRRNIPAPSGNVDNDGWGEDARQVTRSQIERVTPAYQPTKVNMSELQSQKQEPSRFQQPTGSTNGQPDVVKGGYQPIGKVDIAALRREAQQKSDTKDDRPAPVKGSYEPVGKVDIAAIRSRAQGPGGASQAPGISPSATGTSNTSADNEPRSIGGSGRISAMPKPQVSNKFGGGSTFTGTKAPLPGGFDNSPNVPAAPQVGAASKTFADSGGKTPAQQWAERRAKQGGAASTSATDSAPRTISAQNSGGWQSGYSGKKWGSVQTTRTGASAASAGSGGAQEEHEQEEITPSLSGGVSAMRDRFKNAPVGSQVSGGPPPPMNVSSKPNPSRPAEETQRVPPPPQMVPQPEDEEEEEPGDEAAGFRSSSPIRIAQPIARTEEPREIPKPHEEDEAPPMPIRSMAKAAPAEEELEEEPAITDDDPARGAAQASAGAGGGKRAIAQYDYEKAEPNELELREGEEILNIDMVDDDWWMGENSQGESGLFPSNYVELLPDDTPVSAGGSGGATGAARAAPQPLEPEPEPEPEPAASAGKTATAEYDYEAQEENELTFPEGAKITNVVSKRKSGRISVSRADNVAGVPRRGLVAG